mmetsp:Transcript_4359/g.6480  ORF Transcript_4359/g.6480 Transcript_4359/m.6480 type:complete len:97 (-) Transcript_4359:221-511(-)
MRQCNRFMQPSTFVPLRIRFKFSNLPALPTSYFHFSIAGNFNLFLLYPCKMKNPVIGAQVQLNSPRSELEYPKICNLVHDSTLQVVIKTVAAALTR